MGGGGVNREVGSAGAVSGEGQLCANQQHSDVMPGVLQQGLVTGA